MKKTALKSFAALFTLVFVSASVYCSLESLADALAHADSSPPHQEHDSAPHHDAAPEPAHSHHHHDDAVPKGNGEKDDFCCSQLNAITSQLYYVKPLERNLLVAAEGNIVEQTFDFDLRTGHAWLLHDKAPPTRLRSTLFCFLNFSPHAPPSFLAC